MKRQKIVQTSSKWDRSILRIYKHFIYSKKANNSPKFKQLSEFTILYVGEIISAPYKISKGTFLSRKSYCLFLTRPSYECHSKSEVKALKRAC